MKIDYPIPAQNDALMGLWQEAFGDDLDFIEGFYCTGFSPSRCRCVTIDGEVAAALYWLDAQFEGQRFAYIYALAVAKAHRGQGIGRALMADTREHLAYRGYDGILLYPQDDSLRQMYENLGYRTCTTVSRFSCAAGEPAAALQRIDRDTYAQLRRTYLPAGAVIQEEENIAYQEMLSFFYTGEDFLLAARTQGQKLVGLELLGNTDAAPGILTALNCTEGTFQTPGGDIPFAMFLALTPSAKAPEYLGLAFN